MNQIQEKTDVGEKEKYLVLAEEATKWIELHHKEFNEDLRRMIRIKSVSVRNEESGYPFGEGCAHILDYALSRCEELGFRTENHEYYCGSAFLDGETPEELGIFVHLDVVDEGNDWNYPPYEGIELDGFMIGRGAADNKGAAISSLYALRYLKEHSIGLRHTVRLYFGCNEEAGMEDIRYFLQHHKNPAFSIVPDAAFSVCHGEKGSLLFELQCDLKDTNLKEFTAGTAQNKVPDQAQAVITGVDPEKIHQVLKDKDCVVAYGKEDVTIHTDGVSALAADPYKGVSASCKLATILADSSFLDPKTTKAMMFLKKILSDFNGKGLGIAFEDEPSGALTAIGGITCIKDGKFIQTINVKYPVTANAENILKTVRNLCEKEGFEIAEIKDNPPVYVPLDNPAVRCLHTVCNRVLNANEKPYIMANGTYARKLHNAVGYGPGPNPRRSQFGAQRGKGHQPDESMELSLLYHAVPVFVAALYELDQIV